MDLLLFVIINIYLNKSSIIYATFPCRVTGGGGGETLDGHQSMKIQKKIKCYVMVKNTDRK